MTDDYLQFIPTDPKRRPKAKASDRAVELLTAFLPQAEDVSAERFETTQIFHPCENWAGVACPHCAASDEALEDWWMDAVRDAGDQDFANLALTMPCCAAASSLDALTYAAPTAFGRYLLQAQNPKADITPEQEAELAEALGMPVRRVWMKV
jgi:hypothetical protein